MKPKLYKPKKSGAKKFNKAGKEKNLHREYKQKMYQSKEWRNYRFRFLHYNKKCYCCGQPSQVVDHLYIHDGDKELFESVTNSVPMCKLCHNFVTGKFDQCRPQKIEEKIQWIKDCREHYGVKSKIVILESFVKD